MASESQSQPRALQLVAGKDRLNPKPLPVMRDTVLRELEQAGGEITAIRRGHKLTRRDAMRFVLYSVAWHINRSTERVDGYGRRIGPQSARCPQCGASNKEAA